ncbi:MAG: hypothetical protein ACTH6N_06735 [Brachybacterium tyrofermentans]|uniref:hypothetical protein n=1 Tax=Brachybacterium tyrofermentans TaxID=47848 RepID=UPI001866823F|nr:hypothetical protein [Brachybacterium tyrofermentans]
MTAPQPPDAALAAPSPRRTRGGAVIVGPTIRARYVPGALIGLPLVSVLLSPFAAAGIQQWRFGRLREGHDALLEQLLAPAWVQLLVGALLLWALFALWGIVPMLLTHRVVRLDEASGTLALRKGLRTVDRAELGQLDYAVGEAERGSIALIGIRDAEHGPGAAPARPRSRGGEAPTTRQWVVQEIGWDAASFDGLRALQTLSGLRPAPPRGVLVRENRRLRIARANHELADRLGMPWRPEYEHDETAFRVEFDRVRRVLGGKEKPRPGDLV